MYGYRYKPDAARLNGQSCWFARSRRTPLPIVIDTDTYNEIDDQFALTYAMLAPECLRLDAVYAAPFHNGRSNGAFDGMCRSYDEAVRVIEHVGPDHPPAVFRGAEGFLSSAQEPCRSEAAEDMIARALAASPEAPLVVVGIAALTNIASALLLAPEIAPRVVVLWLGGHPYEWPVPDEFNLRQDLAAARVVFDSDVRLVHIPCKNVAEHLRITRQEVEARLVEQGRIGEYLLSIFEAYHPPLRTWSKVIWDIAPIACLINPGWVPAIPCPRRTLDSAGAWRVDGARDQITRVAMDVHRDAIYEDLFNRIEAHRVVPRSPRPAEFATLPQPSLLA